MNCFEKYLVELLQGRITYDNKNVEVVRQFSNAPSIPVITLDLSGQVSTDNYYRTFEGTEKLYFRRSANINISTWCNTEEQRENINKQVMDCFKDSLNHHYKYCSSYNSKTNRCKTMSNDICYVTQLPYNARAKKNQCPCPEKYGYQCLSEKHNLVFGTIVIEPPFFLDETDKHPPLLHSVFSSRADYIEPVSSLGSVTDSFSYIEDDDNEY